MSLSKRLNKLEQAQGAANQAGPARIYMMKGRRRQSHAGKPRTGTPSLKTHS